MKTNESPGSPPDSEFEYRGKLVAVYAVNVFGKPGKYTSQVVIDGVTHQAVLGRPGVSHAEAVRAGVAYAAATINRERDDPNFRQANSPARVLAERPRGG